MQHPTPIPSQSPQKGGELAPVATPAGQFIYIRIRGAFVLPVPSVATNPPSASPRLTCHLYLIEGKFEDIKRFAGTTVDWIIKIAHLICDPRGTGQVHSHTTGTSSEWYNVDRAASWRQVAPGDPILPGIYEFTPAAPIVLSQVSARQSRSVTSLGSESNSTTFRRLLDSRDGACVVTRFPLSLIASHLIPKRLGLDGTKSVVTRFAGEQEALDIHRFHPRIGILLFSSLDSLVDVYELGFFHVAGDTYNLHNFNIANPDLSLIGVPPAVGVPSVTAPPLHNFQTTLSVHAGSSSLPPNGVFDWHYLQCVIKRFGTPQYKNFPDIYFFVHPFRSASEDSDDECSDDDGVEPLYPSYRFDQYLAEQGKRLREQEAREEVARWSLGVYGESEI